MRVRIVVATLAGALLVLGTPGSVSAQGDAGPGGWTPRCGYTHYCSPESGDYGDGEPDRWSNCQDDPYRDNDEDGYDRPCRYSEECTNYARCKD